MAVFQESSDTQELKFVFGSLDLPLMGRHLKIQCLSQDHNNFTEGDIFSFLYCLLRKVTHDL